MMMASVQCFAAMSAALELDDRSDLVFVAPTQIICCPSSPGSIAGGVNHLAGLT
jgi:hypothetical protein